MAMLFVIGLFLFLFSLILGGIVGPIWGMVQCATSDRGAGSKTAWIIALFLLGPIAVVGFAFSGASKWFRNICAWPMLLTSLLLGVLIGGDPELRRLVVEQYKSEIQKIPATSKGFRN
jgi:hypothetical protein